MKFIIGKVFSKVVGPIIIEYNEPIIKPIIKYIIGERWLSNPFLINLTKKIIPKITPKPNIINTGNVLFEGNATVVNCNFSNINSKSEGSLRIKGEGSEVKDSKFESNTASNGGAIYADNKITIDNCSFISNTASSNGGAIVVKGDESKIINSKFEMNKATTGGAIDISGNSNPVQNCIVENCVFNENNASGEWGGSAGALSINNAKNTIDFAFGYLLQKHQIQCYM